MRTGQLENHGLKYFPKKSLFPSGLAPRVIRSDLIAGLTMELDFAHHTERWPGPAVRYQATNFLRPSSRGVCGR
jgi:hypothetical protein